MTSVLPKQSSIAEEAAGWFIRLEGGTLSTDERSQFADWLRESPVHVQEFLFAATTYRALGAISSEERVPLETLQNATLPVVVPLFGAVGRHPGPTRRSDPRPQPLRLARAVGGAFAALALGGLALFAHPLFEGTRSTVIATELGEQKSVPLDDGSVVYLNTQSKVIVTLKKQERRLELSYGEALFEVAHDLSRPFRVQFGRSVVEAVDAAFNVYKQDALTQVAVVEGKVVVSQGKPAGAPGGAPLADASAQAMGTTLDAVTFVTGGYEATVRSDGHVEPLRAIRKNVVLSWRDRRLVFEGETLLAIAREFNRYNAPQIRMRDPVLMAQRFDGVFDANNPEAFIRFLEVTADVKVNRPSPDEIWLER